MKLPTFLKRDRVEARIGLGEDARQLLEFPAFEKALSYALDRALASFRAAQTPDQLVQAKADWEAAERVGAFLRACAVDGENAAKILDRERTGGRRSREQEQRFVTYLAEARAAREAAREAGLDVPDLGAPELDTPPLADDAPAGVS